MSIFKKKQNAGNDIENGKDNGTVLLGFAKMNEDDLAEAAKILCEIWK